MTHIFSDPSSETQTSILILINLAAALLSYSFIAGAFARWRWRGRGRGLVVLTLFLANVVWLIPRAITSLGLGQAAPLYPLWLGDWLGFFLAVIGCNQLLTKETSAMADAARLDHCGSFGIWWHIVLPLVRPALLACGIFILLPGVILLFGFRLVAH